MKKTQLAIAVVSLLSYSSVLQAQDNSSDIETMVVTANRFEMVDAAVLAQTVVVTKDDIEKLQAVSLVDVFRTLPGVEVAQYGGRGQNASLFVRGGSSSQVLVLVDGVRMPRAMMGNVDFNQIPVTGIERVEYIRGARASIYGSEAISGVINIITRADVTESKTKLHAGYGSDNHSLADISFSKALGNDNHIKAVVGYEKTDGYNVHPVEGVNDGDEHGFKSYNAMLGYQQQFTEELNGYIGLSAYNNDYEYDYSYDSSFGSSYQPKEAEIEYRGINATLNYSRDNLNSQLNVSYSEQVNYDYDSGESRGSGDEVEIEQINASWLNSYRFTQQISFGAGIDFRREELKEGYLGSYWSGATSYEPEENPRDNIGVSAIAQHQVSNFTLEASVRSDDNSQYGQHTTLKSAIGWMFAEDYELTASYGTAFKAPSFTDLYYPGSESPDLDPEESENIEISLNGMTSIFDWSITAYRNQIDDMLMWDSSAYKMENIGEAEIKGIELALGFDSDVVRNQFYIDYKDPVDKSDGEEEQLSYRSKRSMKWNASVDVQDWVLGTQYLYEGTRYDSSSEKMPSYSLWNFTAEYMFNEALTLKAKLSNAFDKEYEMVSGYDAPGREYLLSAMYEF